MEKVEEKEIQVILNGCEENSGTAEIRLLDHKRTGSITVREYTDTETGELKKFIDKYGNSKVTRFSKNRIYNLDDITQRLEYNHVKKHPIYCTGPTPVLEAVNIEAVAESEVYQKDMEAEANYIVRKLSGEKLRDFARVLLIGKRIKIGENTSDNVIKKEIYLLAETASTGVEISGAQKIVNEWENPQRSFSELLEKGISNMTFRDKDGVFYYGKQKMGTSKEYALDWFKENKDILPQIRKEVNSKK